MELLTYYKRQSRMGKNNVREEHMNQIGSSQAEFDALDKEYKAYSGKLKADWFSKNRVNSRDVYQIDNSFPGDRGTWGIGGREPH